MPVVRFVDATGRSLHVLAPDDASAPDPAALAKAIERQAIRFGRDTEWQIRVTVMPDHELVRAVAVGAIEVVRSERMGDAATTRSASPQIGSRATGSAGVMQASASRGIAGAQYAQAPDNLGEVCPECDPNDPGYDPAFLPAPVVSEIAAYENQVNAMMNELRVMGCFADGTPVMSRATPQVPTFSRARVAGANIGDVRVASPERNCETERFEYYTSAGLFVGGALFTIGAAYLGQAGWAAKGLGFAGSSLIATVGFWHKLKDCEVARRNAGWRDQ